MKPEMNLTPDHLNHPMWTQYKKGKTWADKQLEAAQTLHLKYLHACFVLHETGHLYDDAFTQRWGECIDEIAKEYTRKWASKVDDLAIELFYLDQKT